MRGKNPQHMNNNMPCKSKSESQTRVRQALAASRAQAEPKDSREKEISASFIGVATISNSIPFMLSVGL